MQFLSVTTAADGTQWTALDSFASRRVALLNKTGTTLEFRRGGDTSKVLQLPDGTAFKFRVQANLSELEVRRVDQSNTQVTIYGDAE